MPQFASLLLKEGFAAGLTTYVDVYPGETQAGRLVLAVEIIGVTPIDVLVDSGAPWCVFDPELLAFINHDEDYAPRTQVRIRGTLYPGTLVRVPITILAEEGDDVAVEATVFVPELAPGDTWRYPNFLGMTGLLSRIRFAVDPTDDTFYFATL